MSFLGYHKVIPYTKFENFGSFVFSCVADKQTDSKILPTPTDRVGMGNKLTIYPVRVKIMTTINIRFQNKKTVMY